MENRATIVRNPIFQYILLANECYFPLAVKGVYPPSAWTLDRYDYVHVSYRCMLMYSFYYVTGMMPCSTTAYKY